MGFSSFLCSKSHVSIPAYPYAEFPVRASLVVLVLPDNKIIQGVYDGYGRIHSSSEFTAYVTKDTVSKYHEDQNSAVDIWEFAPSYDWKDLKIVRADHYHGETYGQLEGCKNCPDQGFFYDDETRNEILKTLAKN